MVRNFAILAGTLLLAANSLHAADRDTQVRDDRKKLQADETWVYNDLDQGLALAKKQGKPLLIVFR